MFFTNQRRGASYRSSSLRKCYLCLFAIMICITIDHIHVTIFICTFFICPKKVPKKGHPKKPLLTEFVRSFEKFGPRINSLRFTPLKQNPLFSPNFPALAHWLLRGPRLFRCRVILKGAVDLLDTGDFRFSGIIYTIGQAWILARYVYLFKKRKYLRMFF